MADASVIEVSKSKFAFLKVLGHAPITIVGVNSVTKPRDFLISCLCLAWGVTFTWICLVHRDKFIISPIDIVNQGNFFIYILSFFAAQFHFVNFFCFRHETWDIVLTLHKIDQIFGRVASRSHIRLESFFIKITVVLIVLSTLLNYAIYCIDHLLLKLFVYEYLGSYYLIVTSSASSVIVSIILRVRVINRHLEAMLHEKKIRRENLSHDDAKRNVDQILKFMKVFGEIIEVNRLANRCYGLPVMVDFALLFSFTTFVGFWSSKDLTDTGSLSKMTIAYIVYLSTMNLLSSLIVLSCELSVREATKTVRLLNKLVKCSKDETETQMLISLSFLINRNKPVLSCGLFEFNLSLINGVSSKTFASEIKLKPFPAQMLAMLVSNFVILYQFDQASGQKV